MMNAGTPSKATPAGCLVGMIGLALLALAGITGFITFKRVLLREPERDLGSVFSYGIASLAGLLLGLFLVRLGWRMALAADMSAPDDQERPKMRF